jgi:hypothetical protein
MKEGQIMQGGPDHYAPCAATKHFRDFLIASQQIRIFKKRCSTMLNAFAPLPRHDYADHR